jgi:hypothetical protein
MMSSIIYPLPHQLFIDIDTDAQFEEFQRRVSLMRCQFRFTICSVTPSKSGPPHRHIIIDLESPYPPLVRIALQACLGSDPAREFMLIRLYTEGGREGHNYLHIPMPDPHGSSITQLD